MDKSTKEHLDVAITTALTANARANALSMAIYVLLKNEPEKQKLFEDRYLFAFRKFMEGSIEDLMKGGYTDIAAKVSELAQNEKTISEYVVSED